MIQNRIIEYLKFKGISKYKFYKDTGLSNGFLDKKGSIGVDKCELIYSCYSDINLEWLITGNGEKLKKDNIKSVKYEKTEILLNSVLLAQQEIINNQHETIEQLKQTNERFKIINLSAPIFSGIVSDNGILEKKDNLITNKE